MINKEMNNNKSENSDPKEVKPNECEEIVNVWRSTNSENGRIPDNQRL
jgi:hypothetical protein